METFAPDSLERVYSSTDFPSISPNGFEVTENLAAEAAKGRKAQRVRVFVHNRQEEFNEIIIV